MAVLKGMGVFTWSGSGATATATVDAATTDKVFCAITVKPSQAAYLTRSVISSSNTLTVELSAANTSNDAQITYLIVEP